jgi:hypothetical protein
MNLLRSICCLFACAPKEGKSTGDTTRGESSASVDLGQREAELEKTGKEQMSHMEGDDVTKSAEQEPTRRSSRKPRL